MDGQETSDAIHFSDNDQENTLTITGSIIWGNGNDDGGETTIDVDGNLVVSYSIMENSETGPWPGTGNIWNDPLFTDPEGDFTLLPGSRAIDLADPADDYADEPQPNGGRANSGFHGGTVLAEKVQLYLNRWVSEGLSQAVLEAIRNDVFHVAAPVGP